MLDEVTPKAILDDKAMTPDALIGTLDQRGIVPVIACMANSIKARKANFALHRKRNLVDSLYNKISRFRVINTRHD